MKDLINKIISSGLSPNSYVTLFVLNEKLSLELPYNATVEMRVLKDKGYLDKENQVTIKGLNALQGQILNTEFHKEKEQEEKSLRYNAVKFIQIFPPRILPSGAHARGHLNPVMHLLKNFRELYKYDWETMFEAAENYVERFRERGYKYMRNCPNFILNKEGESLLALECDIVENNKLEETGTTL